MHNLEFKAELRDLSIARAVAVSIGARRIGVLEQTDTYYRTFTGRLKKREAVFEGQPEPVEYIAYERDDRARPKVSSFRILSESEFLERFGSLPLPEGVVVRKSRELYLLENARIHLDRVESLGSFIEFEALVTKSHNLARAHETINDLRARFGPVLGEAIAVGYADLLAQDSDPAGSPPERPGLIPPAGPPLG